MNVINQIEKIKTRIKQINLLLQKARGTFDLSNYYDKGEVDALLAAQDALSELADVLIVGLVDNQILRYDLASGKWKNENEVDQLSELTDVNLAGLADGDGIYYDLATGKFIAAAPPGGAGESSEGAPFGIRLQGQYYTLPVNCGSQPSRSSQTLDNLRAVPFPVPHSQNFDRIGTNVDGVANAKLRLGIYDSSNGFPNNLILDSGELDSSVSGDVEAVINETLPLGLYWLAHLGSHTQAIRAFGRSNVMALMGSDSMGFVYPSNAFSVAKAYGALPDPFTGGGATREWSTSPAVYLRKS